MKKIIFFVLNCLVICNIKSMDRGGETHKEPRNNELNKPRKNVKTKPMYEQQSEGKNSKVYAIKRCPFAYGSGE